MASRQATLAEANPTEQLGGGVTLRWKTVAPTHNTPAADQRSQELRQQFSHEVSQAGGYHAATAQPAPSANVSRDTQNPLRSQVMQVAYQQPQATPDMLAPPALPPTGSTPLPAFPGAAQSAPALPPGSAFPGFGNGPEASGPEISSPEEGLFGQPDMLAPQGPAAQNLPQPPLDPLDSPEKAPAPNFAPGSANGSSSILEGQRPSSPFPPRREAVTPEDASPADREPSPDLLPAPNAADGAQDRGNELKRRNEAANSGYCDEMRSRIRATPITAVSLDVSPEFGAGFKARKDSEQLRLDFAASAPVRQWTNYRGDIVATGRMIDLRDGHVIIDADGGEVTILLRNLSDVDTAYVGESWNIPERCGTGYDPFHGRSFVPATVQWTASGLCHKPLYFEQPQLERYGHELGPVLQPIVSSAHFFGNIPLLPYKMGIHPPYECQYELGHYRPGDCVPYMLRPFPWSLRGAAVQAAAVTGGAALIP